MWELPQTRSRGTPRDFYERSDLLFPAILRRFVANRQRGDVCESHTTSRISLSFKAAVNDVGTNPLICERDTATFRGVKVNNRYNGPRKNREIPTWWLCVLRSILRAPPRPYRESCFRRRRWKGLTPRPDRSCRPILLSWLTCYRELHEI